MDEACLYNVLKAFWNIDDEIGYCQGMNYITGFLLINRDFNEKKAFFLLISIFSNNFFKMKKNFFSLRGLFIEEFPLLYFYIFIFDDLLNKCDQNLRKHLLNNDITNDFWIINGSKQHLLLFYQLNGVKNYGRIFLLLIFFLLLNLVFLYALLSLKILFN